MKTKLLVITVFTVLTFGLCVVASVLLFSAYFKNNGEPAAVLNTVTDTAKPSPTVQPSEKASLTPSPTPSPVPTPTVYTVDMKVTGDLMVHSWQLNFAYDKQTDSYNFDYGFAPVKKYLEDADITIGNLETTFAGKQIGYSDYPMFNTPDSFGQTLKDAGYDFVTTANNHCNDKWEKGILRTIEVLDELGIRHTGTFASQEDRDNICTTEINGISFAFISYTYGTNGLPLTDGKPWLANIMDETALISDIKKARALNPDFVIVFPHMGNEYETAPREVFKDWAKLMLKAGADIVLASHPHVLQPVEFYSVLRDDGTYADCFTAYSLGNFISSQRDIPRESGMIMHLSFEKVEGQKAELKQLSYIPTWVKFVDKNGKQDIKVFGVKDALDIYESGEDTNFKPSDIERLKQVHAQTTKMFLGEALPLSEIHDEYVIPKNNVIKVD